jgi:hypothetical protein
MAQTEITDKLVGIPRASYRIGGFVDVGFVWNTVMHESPLSYRGPNIVIASEAKQSFTLITQIASSLLSSQ